MDPPTTETGEPFGPARFKAIVQERFFISKNSNNSYVDVGLITPMERQIIMDLIVNLMKLEREEYKKLTEGLR